MIFEVYYKKKFKEEFKNFPSYQQDKILSFVDIFENYGFKEYSLYEGKISNSWTNANQPNYLYAKLNNLYHYHIGIPFFEKKHDKYSTSDYVLHFQYYKHTKKETIHLVDIYKHYDKDGNFYLPPQIYLE